MLSAVSKLSVDSLTFRALLVAGATIAALILLGRGKPARPGRWTPPPLRRTEREFDVEQIEVKEYTGTSIWRRLCALVGSTAMAFVSGILLATIIALGLIYAISTLTSLLKH